MCACVCLLDIPITDTIFSSISIKLIKQLCDSPQTGQDQRPKVLILFDLWILWKDSIRIFKSE